MADVNKVIGIGVDPSGAQKGARVVKSELEGIGRSAGKAKRDVMDLGSKGGKAVQDLGNKTKVAKGHVASLTSEAKRLALTFIGVAAAVRIVSSAITQSLDFSRAIGEVGTLGADMDATAAKAREFAKTFGTSAQLQVKAFYQTYSAGASTLAEASKTLEVANKLAIGGATDVETAVDGLTSVLNAYGDAVESATAVSDAMFVAMKAGKTTIGELSAALGRVTPLAAALGVEFDEVAAAVAALTKGGVTTKMAVTQLQAILSNIVKPTSEAAKASKDLDFEFNAAALSAQGLSKFLQGLIKATGGSVETIGQLFGSVEGLGAVLAFAGQAGLDFNAILKDMETKAGATEAAFQTMSEMFNTKWNQAVAKASDAGLTLGNALLTVLVPVLTVVSGNIDVLVASLAALAVFFAVGQLPAFVGWVTKLGAAFIVAARAAAPLVGVLSVMGWPVGVAIAAGAAVLAFSRSTSSAADESEKLEKILKKLNITLSKTGTTAEGAAKNVGTIHFQNIKAAEEGIRIAEGRIRLEEETREVRLSALSLHQRLITVEATGALAFITASNNKIAAQKEIIEQLDVLIDTEKELQLFRDRTGQIPTGAGALAGFIDKFSADTAEEALKRLAEIKFTTTIGSAKELSETLAGIGQKAGMARAKILTLSERTSLRDVTSQEKTLKELASIRTLQDRLSDLDKNYSEIQASILTISDSKRKDIFGANALPDVGAKLDIILSKYVSIGRAITTTQTGIRGQSATTDITKGFADLASEILELSADKPAAKVLSEFLRDGVTKMAELRVEAVKTNAALKAVKGLEHVVTPLGATPTLPPVEGLDELGKPIDIKVTVESAQAETALERLHGLIEDVQDKEIKVTVESAQAETALERLHALIESIKSKTVTINVNTVENGVPTTSLAPAVPTPATAPATAPASAPATNPPAVAPATNPPAVASLPATTSFSSPAGGAAAASELQGFAHGGVTNEPAIFGEAGPEAAVPLPDGTSIPVTLTDQTTAGPSTVQSTVSGSATLKAIEINTAQTAAFTERALGFLDVIQSDMAATFREMVRTRIDANIRSASTNDANDFLTRMQGLLALANAAKISTDTKFLQNIMTAQFHEGGVIPASGGGSTDSRAIQILTRPDETIAIQTPAQRKGMVDAFDRQFESGKQQGSRSVNFNGGITIHVPSDSRSDRRSARALADEFTRQVQSNLSPLYKD